MNGKVSYDVIIKKKKQISKHNEYSHISKIAMIWNQLQPRERSGIVHLASDTVATSRTRYSRIYSWTRRATIIFPSAQRNSRLVIGIKRREYLVPRIRLENEQSWTDEPLTWTIDVCWHARQTSPLGASLMVKSVRANPCRWPCTPCIQHQVAHNTTARTHAREYCSRHYHDHAHAPPSFPLST